jgi:hypothetical protein
VFRLFPKDWIGSPYLRAGTCLEAAYPIAKRFSS